LAQGENIIPIPGTRQEKYLRDNIGAVDVVLTADDLARINEALPAGAAAGTRYHETMMNRVNV
jgi:aryl-alcohol dehydrogenase-like predicted oxidoreductase